MRVWMLSNQNAGRSLSDAALRALVSDAGHTLVDLVNAKDEDLTLPRSNVDVVVAAGGDGTVATAARLVDRTSTPFAILPLGTANNIAASVEMSRDVPQLIASWNRARRTPFDLARARGRSQQWTVVEGLGGGLVPAGINTASPLLEDADAHPAHELAAAVQLFEIAFRHLEPLKRTIVVDDTPLPEELLFFEVLNIRSVGPNLSLAPQASVSDGRFDVVFAEPGHRAEVLAYFKERRQDRETVLALPRRRARRVRIETSELLHVDDDLVDGSGAGDIDITVAPGAATILL